MFKKKCTNLIEPKPISVNIAIWPYCNYRCKFCFGKYVGLLEEFEYSKVMDIPDILACIGTEKITVEGGEPLLYPNLKEFLKKSASAGLVTAIITNGSLMTERKLRDLAPYLDWIGISVDSANEIIERQLGRGYGKHISNIKKVAKWAKRYDIKLKVNSVITRLNYTENLIPLYRELEPDRIKTFQVLFIEGENDIYKEELFITNEEYTYFVERHSVLLKEGYHITFEYANDMLGSYLMLFPNGRFLDNSLGKHLVSKNTLFDNPEKALQEINWSYSKFLKRGGLYEW